MLAKAWVIIYPEADQLKTSIQPGVSTITKLKVNFTQTYSKFGFEFIILTTWSNCAANRLRLVIIAPFGPSP